MRIITYYIQPFLSTWQLAKWLPESATLKQPKNGVIIFKLVALLIQPVASIIMYV